MPDVGPVTIQAFAGEEELVMFVMPVPLR